MFALSGFICPAYIAASCSIEYMTTETSREEANPLPGAAFAYECF
jgi:hypothetical protein